MFQSAFPLRAQASDAAEMLSQLLFGDVVELLARDRQWMQVRVEADGHVGWIDEKSVLEVDAEWLAALQGWGYVWEDVQTFQTRRAGSTLPLRLGLGSRIPVTGDGRTLQIGGWSMDLGEWKPQHARQWSGAEIAALSARYLGTPYLWGGKSLAGIDCSGLTQVVMAMAGHQLPRDSKDQAECGVEVPFEARAAGDLAFFTNASGKVHHVGIVLEDGNIRHASGHVHDAVLTADGIVGKYTGLQTHIFSRIKRIV